MTDSPDDFPPEQARNGIDSTVPHSARIWNYWLGGKDNYPVDRKAGDDWLRRDPTIRDLARAQRAFLGRVVGHLAGEEGIRQFLDIGTGLPTAENTHEVAQRIAPDARVVYVDNDPLVLAHARALLAGTPEGATSYIHADVRETDSVLSGARKTLDFQQPIALMLLGVLGHVDDADEARALVQALVEALPSGSFLIVADGGGDPDQVEAAKQYAATGAIAYTFHTYSQVLSLFDGLTLVEPGLVLINDWRPVPSIASETVNEYGGVGRKV